MLKIFSRILIQQTQTVMKTVLTTEELSILFGLGFKRVDANSHNLITGNYWYDGTFFVTVERGGFLNSTNVNVYTGKGKLVLVLNSVSELISAPGINAYKH